MTRLPLLLAAIIAFGMLAGCAFFQNAHVGATVYTNHSDASGSPDANSWGIAIGISTGLGYPTPPSNVYVPVHVQNAAPSQNQSSTHTHGPGCHWHPHGWKCKKDKDD